YTLRKSLPYSFSPSSDKSALSKLSLSSVSLSQSDPTSGISDAAATKEIPPISSPTLAEALPNSFPALVEVLPNTLLNSSPTIGCEGSSNPKPSLSSKL
uniref:Uncharacterized protein n=1 Tax=Solanum lycopersicum TaxID=4081 RepID=A0A3Q7GC88_SOLLC